MPIEFYDVKLRDKVQIDESKIWKVKIDTNKSGIRYALKAKTHDNRSLTRFVSKADWDAFQDAGSS